jgi:hypothetical protein
MPKKGYISEQMTAGRIVSHGKITSLSGGFRLPSNLPFSIYIRPKTSVSNLDIALNVKCYQDEAASEAPFVFNDWSPLAIVEISSGQDSILDTNDLYWGSGYYIETE